MSRPIDDTIDKHTQDARAKGKGYSLIPEFNISEHIDYYVESNGGNFLADNNSMFTINGGQVENSSVAEFAKVYSNSDFLKDFARIRKEHKDEAHPTRIDLKASAIMKFVPYEGFYPVERCVKLAELFSQSYGGNIELTGTQANYRTAIQPLFAPGILFNSIKSGLGVSSFLMSASSLLNDPTYGDIHHNASGNKVARWALYTFPTDINGIRDKIKLKRPFETLIEPERYLANTYIRDNIAHPSGILDSTASIGSGKPLYSMAVHNFVASTIDFFLPNNSLSSIVSADDNDTSFFNFELKKEYRMRCILRGCDNYDLVSIIDEAQADSIDDFVTLGYATDAGNIIHRAIMSMGTQGSTKYSKPNFEMYARPFFDTASLEDTLQSNAYSRAESYIHGGSAFGPPIEESPLFFFQEGATTNYTTPFGQITYAAWTPPYYEGFAYVDFIFKPTGSDGVIYKDHVDRGSVRYTLTEVLNNLTASYYRYSGMPIKDYFDYDFQGGALPTDDITGSDVSIGNTATTYATTTTVFKMQISDVLNLFGTIKNKSVEFDENGRIQSVKDDTTAGDRWVISPKWELPIFNYENSCVSDLPASGSQNIGRGVWHNFGEELAAEQGLFMQMIEYPKKNYTKRTDIDFETTPPYVIETDTFHTASLADAIGFSPEAVKLGRLGEGFTVSEAIVAIPFIDNGNDREFFKLDQGLVDLAITGDVFNVNGREIASGMSVNKTVEAMKKYVIPPKFDFVKYDGKEGRSKVDPIVMYFFEFDYFMTRDDLKKVWHNIEPEARMLESETTIGHELLENELMSEFEDSVRWMVFKVKQKAEWNYYAKTADSSDDKRFKFKLGVNDAAEPPAYSYNWPFDYMSVIEYGKFDVAVTIETEEESLRRRSNFISTKKFDKDVIEQIDIRERLKRSGLGGRNTQGSIVPINTNSRKIIKGGDVQQVVKRIRQLEENIKPVQNKEEELKQARQEQPAGSRATIKPIRLPDSLKDN